MATGYIGSPAPPPIEKEERRASALEKGAVLGKHTANALKWVNKRNERLLAESGWLDETFSKPKMMYDTNTKKMVPTGEMEYEKIFKKKAGRGAFRKPEDRLQLTDKGKEHFASLAKESGRPAWEEYNDYVKGLGEGNEALGTVLGTEKEEAFIKGLEGRSKTMDETQTRLFSEANIRAKELMDNPFVQSTGGLQYQSGFKPKNIMRSTSNIGMKPDLISGRQTGVGFGGMLPGQNKYGIMPQITRQGSGNIFTRPTDLVGQNLMNQQAQQRAMGGAINLRDRFGQSVGQSPIIQSLNAIPQIGQGGMKTIGQNALKSVFPGFGTGAATGTAAGLGAGATTAGTAAAGVGGTGFLAGMGPAGILTGVGLTLAHKLLPKLFKGLFG